MYAWRSGTGVQVIDRKPRSGLPDLRPSYGRPSSVQYSNAQCRVLSSVIIAVGHVQGLLKNIAFYI